MSADGERARTLSRIRDALLDLAAEGVDFVPGRAKLPPPARPAQFTPRVAPLAQPTQISVATGEKAARLVEIRKGRLFQVPVPPRAPAFERMAVEHPVDPIRERHAAEHSCQLAHTRRAALVLPSAP